LEENFSAEKNVRQKLRLAFPATLNLRLRLVSESGPIARFLDST
jgi:hypothetical protein